MSSGERTILSWSSGKDSAWALHLLRQTPGIEVVALVTSFSQPADRVAMHAVRRSLVEAQAERAALPLWTLDLPARCSNEDYQQRMESIWQRAREDHVINVAFGDLFLADIRAYRERQLQLTGLKPIFPLWHLPTAALAREMLAGALRAKITCVDPAQLDRRCAGGDFDHSFLASLPPSVDPCGENGEFHTFVYQAPVFTRPIPVETGVVLERDGFVFADVLPPAPRPAIDPGLCAGCRHSTIIVSDRGSRFYRCALSDQDPSFPRFPRLPLHECAGYSPALRP